MIHWNARYFSGQFVNTNIKRLCKFQLGSSDPLRTAVPSQLVRRFKPGEITIAHVDLSIISIHRLRKLPRFFLREAVKSPSIRLVDVTLVELFN